MIHAMLKSRMFLFVYNNSDTEFIMTVIAMSAFMAIITIFKNHTAHA